MINFVSESEGMQLVKPTTEEQRYWDELVLQHRATVFSQSRYLNALSGDWMILFNSSRTGGMVCPFTVKAGKRILVNPVYHQFSEWVGEGSLTEDGLEVLKNNFPVAILNIDADLPIGVQCLHQLLTSNDLKLNDLAKRSLKKSLNYQIRLNQEVSSVYALISDEIVPKVAGMDAGNLPFLRRLVEAFENGGLRSYCAYENDRFVGGIWILENETRFMYLKGTAESEAKKNGAVYAMMHQAITDCFAEGKEFDFGGSNVASVQRFNYNFGGKDHAYTQLNWNHAPWWWNTLRNAKKRLRGK